jgi:hypothetical protein
MHFHHALATADAKTNAGATDRLSGLRELPALSAFLRQSHVDSRAGSARDRNTPAVVRA